MYACSSRAVRVTLAGLLTALAACVDQPPPTAPSLDVAPQFAPGDEILVTTLSGGTDVGSLRWAAAQVTGGEVIRFAAGLAGQTIMLDSTVVLDWYAIIEGPADQGITVSGAGKGRVFEFTHAAGEVVLRNLTVSGGNLSSDGGAGIVSLGASLKLENSTVTGNVAYANPAIRAQQATLVNSTVSGNTATIPYSNGSAIEATILSLVNSTVAYNTGGVNFEQLVVQNSLIANHDRANCARETGIVLQGQNLVDDDTCSASDHISPDPELSPLADNGGPTMTHALAATSPAINAGTECSVSVDQRYVARDALCDIGAYEAPGGTTVQLAMAASALVGSGDGKVVVTGTVMCSQDETFDLQVELVQKRGRAVVSGSGTTHIACGTSVQPWQIEVLPAGGSFQNGSAQAKAFTLNTSERVRPASISQSIKLIASKK